MNDDHFPPASGEKFNEVKHRLDQIALHLHQVLAKFGLDPLGKIPDLHHKSPDAPQLRESNTPSLVRLEEEESSATSEMELVSSKKEIKVSSLRMTLIPDVDFHVLYHGNFMDVVPIGDDIVTNPLSCPVSGPGTCSFGF